MEPVVRLTRPGDINSVTTMDLKCYQYPMDMKTWHGLIHGSGQRGQARIVLVEVYRQPAGFAMWSIDESDMEGELHRLGVLPKYRLRGLGKVLAAACIRHCYDSKCDMVRTVVPDIHCRPGDDDDVSVFLNKCGFKATGDIIPNFRRMYGKDVDGYLFKRGTHALTN